MLTISNPQVLVKTAQVGGIPDEDHERHKSLTGSWWIEEFKYIDLGLRAYGISRMRVPIEECSIGLVKVPWGHPERRAASLTGPD